VPLRRPRRFSGTLSLARAVAAAAPLLSLAACRDAVSDFGPTAAAAQANGSELFSALAARFTNVERTPKFYAARSKLARSALTPSRIFGDTSVWTGAAGDSRQLAVAGIFANDRYTFDATPSPLVPNRGGDSRHFIHLKRLAEDEFEWTTNVDMAVGHLRAEDFANVFSALLASAAGRSEPAIRADYRTAMPRTTTALARLLSLDTIRTVPQSDGATAVTLVVRLHSERLRPGFSAFADYVDRYVAPSKYRIVLRSHDGARWFESTADGRRFVIRLRVLNGSLAPLDGFPRPLPDSLRLTVDFSTRIRAFTVGVSDLVGDFTILRAPHERGWHIRFRREPDWHLPLATRYLIRSSLRRPFEDGGATVRIALRDSIGAQTLVTRRTTGTVKEGTVLRFLGGLSGTAMSEFAGKAEAQENRFTAELFNAMRDDLRAIPTAAFGPVSSRRGGAP
jgi:hypothetical protein